MASAVAISMQNRSWHDVSPGNVYQMSRDLLVTDGGQVEVGSLLRIEGMANEGPFVAQVVQVMPGDQVQVRLASWPTPEEDAVAGRDVPPWFAVGARFQRRGVDGDEYFIVRSINYNEASFEASSSTSEWPRIKFDFRFRDLVHYNLQHPSWLVTGAHLWDERGVEVVVTGVLGWRIVCRTMDGQPRLGTNLGEVVELTLPQILKSWKPKQAAPVAVKPPEPLTRFDRDDVI